MIPKPVITQCRSCQADIVWLWTKNNKKMPVNADSLGPDDDRLTEYDHLRHVTHYATCPQAKHWTKKKGYPDNPGYKVEGTSKAAAEAKKPTKEESWKRVIAVLETGDFTPDEIADRADIDRLDSRPRCSELKDKGILEATGITRPNVSGREADVLRLKKDGRPPLPAVQPDLGL